MYVRNKNAFKKIIDFIESSNALKEMGEDAVIFEVMPFSVDMKAENVGNFVASVRTYKDNPFKYYGEVFIYGKVLNATTIYDVLNFLTTKSINKIQNL